MFPLGTGLVPRQPGSGLRSGQRMDLSEHQQRRLQARLGRSPIGRAQVGGAWWSNGGVCFSVG